MFLLKTLQGFFQSFVDEQNLLWPERFYISELPLPPGSILHHTPILSLCQSLWPCFSSTLEMLLSSHVLLEHAALSTLQFG